MKTSYNYHANVKNDILSVIADRNIVVTAENKADIFEALYDDLFIDDSVTGNGSGSYTFNAYEAEENLCHNTELLREACEEFGGNLGEWFERGAEYCDVSIRCYLLGECLFSALEELAEETANA
jgi:hypothetical protein